MHVFILEYSESLGPFLTLQFEYLLYFFFFPLNFVFSFWKNAFWVQGWTNNAIAEKSRMAAYSNLPLPP